MANNPEPVEFKPSPPPLFAEYEAFEGFFSGNHQAIKAHLEPIFFDVSRPTIDRYYALVLLAQYITNTQDCLLADRLIELATLITRNAKPFFNHASDREAGKEYKASVKIIMDILEQHKSKPVVSAVTKSSKIKPEQQVVKSTNSSYRRMFTYMPRRQLTYADACTALTTLPNTPSQHGLQSILNAARPTHQLEPFVFPFSPAQLKVRDYLYEEYWTFIHGSSILSKMHQTKVNDIDLLCYADAKTLHEYFLNHESEFGISEIRMDTNVRISANEINQVIVISFHERMQNGDSQQLEILCRGELRAVDIPADMKRLLKSYYLNRMLCDPVTGWCIDFFIVYDKLRYYYLFDQVTTQEIASPNQFFSETPIRMIEIVATLAFFRSQGVNFRLSRYLLSGIEANAYRLRYSADGSHYHISENKFFKLFSRFHAAESYIALCESGLFQCTRTDTCFCQQPTLRKTVTAVSRLRYRHESKILRLN